MRTVVYTRASKGDPLAIARQREDGLKLARERGWSVVAELGDDDRSAAGRKVRPDFNRLLGMVDAGEVDAVIAWSFDRLTRNRQDTLRLIETCRDRGTFLALVRGADLDLSTPSGRLTADILAATAQAEIDMKGDRERRAVQQAVAQGRRRGGRRPFGFELDMTPRPDEAAAVRWAYRELLASTSLGAIAREWNSRGLTTPQERWKAGGRPLWTSQSVSRALRKAAYAGLRSHQGTVAGPAVWDALVDESTWRAAQAALDDKTRLKNKGGPRALLTGIAVCGVDGCGLTVHTGGGNAAARNYRVYRCRSMKHVNRRAEPIEEFVSAVVVERLARDDARDLLRAVDTPDVADLHAQADALRRRVDGLADDTSIPERVMARRARALEVELSEVETRLADAGRVNALGDLVAADDVAKVWERLNTDRQRAVVNILLSVTILPVTRGARTFDPESVRIEWRRS